MTNERDGFVWVEYQDRIVGLVVFGLIQAALGALCALFVPVMFFSWFMQTQYQPAIAQPLETMIGAMVIYGGASVLFVVLGVGSILARRWARALSLAVWTLWLSIGVIGLLVWLPLMSTFGTLMEELMANPAAMGGPGGGPPMPPGMIQFMMIFMAVAAVVIGIGVPLPFVLFYRGRHVKATCNWRDPKPRWTDRCPLPLLIGAISMAGELAIGVQFVSYGMYSAFGVDLAGPAAWLPVLVTAAVSLAAMVGLFKRRLWGWLLAVVLLGFETVRWFVAAASGDIEAIPGGMATAAQFPQMEAVWQEYFTKAIWVMGVFYLIWLVYVLWLWRYVRPGSATAPESQPPPSVV